MARPGISKRQLDVLHLLVMGMDNKTIAAICNISDGTVKNMMGRLCEAYNAESRLELALIATRALPLDLDTRRAARQRVADSKIYWSDKDERGEKSDAELGRSHHRPEDDRRD